MRKTLLFVIMSIIIMTSCKNGIKGNGYMVSKEITIEDYNNLAIQDHFDVVYVQRADEKPYLRIEIDENLLEYVSATVENSKLTIKSTRSIDPKHYKIYTNSTSLSEVSASGMNNVELKDSIRTEKLHLSSSGMGHIQGENIHCQNLSVSTSGIADITLGGEANNVNMSVSGKANIHAYELKSQNADCSVSGMGDIDVYATEILSARVSGVGKINYKGNPKEKNISSTGVGSVNAKE